MTYYYQVFGLACASEIKLPALLSIAQPELVDFEVRLVKNDLPGFESSPNVVKPFSSFNEREFLYNFPEVAGYFVRDGKEIWVKPLCTDWDSILLFFYSNAIAALLFQRNLIPFHVSGVLDEEDNAWLFLAPTRTGKSTTAIMLQELGYKLLTDDTCLLTNQHNEIYAVPSYPMIRAWKPTLDYQTVHSKEDAFQIRAEVEKFGVFFHEKFRSTPALVKGIFFLEVAGDKVLIEPQKTAIGMKALGQNTYRNQWINGMNKQILHFQVITSVAKKIPFFKATRPKNVPSFKEFAQAIHEQISIVNGR